MKNNLPAMDMEVEVPANEYLVSESDVKGRITYANAAFAETSGYPIDTLVGASHNIIRHPDMPRQIFEELWQSLNNGHPWQGVLKNRCSDGRYYWVNATIVPITVNNEHIGYMSVRKRASAEEKSAAEAMYAEMRAGRVKKPKSLQASPEGLLRSLVVVFLLWILVGAGIGIYSMGQSHDALATMYTQLQDNQRVAESEIHRLSPGAEVPQALTQNVSQARALFETESTTFHTGLTLVLLALFGGGVLAFLYYRNLLNRLCGPLTQAVRDCERISHGDLVKPIKIDPNTITRRISESLATMQTHLMVMIEEVRQGVCATRTECHSLQEATQKNVNIAETQYLYLQKVRDLLDEIAGSFTDTSNQAEALLESFLQPGKDTDPSPRTPAQIEHEFRELVTATRLSAFIIEDCLRQLNEVNELIVESREISHAVHHSAESLRSMARMLADLIGRFKTTEDGTKPL